jgi:hypothetical protein
LFQFVTPKSANHEVVIDDPATAEGLVEPPAGAPANSVGRRALGS